MSSTNESALKKRKLNDSTISEEQSLDSESDEGNTGFNTSNVDVSFDSIVQKKPIRPREKRSDVWNYFDIQEINANGQVIKVGKCKNCPFYGKYSSSTSFMKEHIRKCKGITHPATPSNNPESAASVPNTEEETTNANTTTPKAEEPLVTPKSKRTARVKLVSDSVLKDVAKLTTTPSEADYPAIWEYIQDARRALYPKALAALLEDLGVFEMGDLTSLDIEQFSIIASLLKPAPNKAFMKLLKGEKEK